MMFLTERHSKILELQLSASAIHPKYNDLFSIAENNLVGNRELAFSASLEGGNFSSKNRAIYRAILSCLPR